jgi:hypothetical protein
MDAMVSAVCMHSAWLVTLASYVSAIYIIQQPLVCSWGSPEQKSPALHNYHPPQSLSLQFARQNLPFGRLPVQLTLFQTVWRSSCTLWEHSCCYYNYKKDLRFEHCRFGHVVSTKLVFDVVSGSCGQSANSLKFSVWEAGICKPSSQLSEL